MCDICRDGFPYPVRTDEFSIPATSTSPVIWLTNSVNIADVVRLSQQGRGMVGQGKLLLCKVFVGQAAETTDSVV